MAFCPTPMAQLQPPPPPPHATLNPPIAMWPHSKLVARSFPRLPENECVREGTGCTLYVCATMRNMPGICVGHAALITYTYSTCRQTHMFLYNCIYPQILDSICFLLMYVSALQLLLP